ncbi:outer membrane protein TolC [Runella defluvii]|uniref:Outer membrane protein TolC n=1 Tax=Runella defluvii TaxID=370973 RepID=A0A7W5ZH45_9BACT|nr:TolC family protein [Runella defluvii]MBB3836723.1 outer membrane protein TolC [Runella defluvii]
MKKIAVFLTLLLSASLPSFAQQTWSLKACLDYGLQHFGSVRIAQYQQETANEQARQALGTYMPQVSATGNFTDNLKLQSTLLPAGFAGPEPKRISLGSKYQTVASAQLTQTIYDKAALLGLKAAEPNQKLADLSMRQTKEEIIYNIASNYYQVFIVKQQIALLKDNLDRTEKVLNVLRLQRDNGVIQAIDVTNTEVTYNNTRSQLALSESNLALALNRLKYQMGLTQDQDVNVSDSLLLRQTPQVETSQFNAPGLVSYQKAATNLELQKLQLQRIKAGYQPTVSFTASYGSMALGNQFADGFRNFTGFGSVGLRLNVPIFDGFQRDAQYKQQRLTILTQEEQLRMNVAAFGLQFNNAQTQIQKASTSIQNDERTVKQAQEVYNVVTLQYKQGTKSLTDLINADNSYRQSQSNYINSLINFYQARLDLEQSQGTLLTFYNQL